MEIYCPEHPKQSLPSYEFPFNKKGHGSNLYEINWVIKSWKNSEKFLTVRAISIVGSEVMCGRASIVWEVVKLADCHKSDKVR
jgi:hypothetical protein